MELSPNGYYNYKKHRKNAKNKEKASVLKKIETIYHAAGGKPGYRMMKDLLDTKGIHLSKSTVHKYMNSILNLRSVTRKKKKYVYSKGSEAFCIFDNLLNQDFTASERYSRWCVDFTYLFLESGAKRYNCTIIDLYDRAVVASVNGRKINTELAIKALTIALQNCPGKKGILLHSDRGSQFTSKEFVEFCKKNGVIQSMSKPGYPYDNAPMERYYNTLKAELINLHEYRTEEELYNAVNMYAYGWYNNVRPHNFNGGLPPKKVA